MSEQISPAENPGEPTATPTPNTVRLVALLPETFQAVVQYLESRPIGDHDAVKVYNSLSQPYTVEGVING